MAERIEIRPCRAAECPAVLDLWEQAEATPSATDDPAALDQLLGERQAALLVAVQGDWIIGSVITGWDGWRGNIYRLAVAPEYRRRGLARALVREAERFLAARGARRVSALVEADHPWAVGFWSAAEGMGWTRDPRMIRHVKTVEARG